MWGDNMVLQFAPSNCQHPACPTPAKVFGIDASPGETITLSASGSNPLPESNYTATVLPDGTWFIVVASDAGGPFDLVLSSSHDATQALTAHSVYFGDVIICSGQSNMEYELNGIDDGAAAVAAANHPNLHLYSAPDNSTYPDQFHPTSIVYEFPGPTEWSICTPTTAKDFSAICYLTAINLMQLLGDQGSRHIGLIQSAKGGTPVEGWCPPDALQRCNVEPLAYPIPCQSGDVDPAHPSKPNTTAEYWAHPSTLYNQMIGPLIGYSARSFLWYQGEANMNEGFHLSRHNYFCLFSSMIQSWRTVWHTRFAPAVHGHGAPFGSSMGFGPIPTTPPFNFVQLHACDSANEGQVFADFSNYGDIRMAQDDTQRFVPGTGMAVSFDRGHVGIHSPHKKDVGRRLALKVWSNAFNYGDDGNSSGGNSSGGTSSGGSGGSGSGGSGSGGSVAPPPIRSNGPILQAACVVTAPTDTLPAYRGTNVTQVLLKIANIEWQSAASAASAGTSGALPVLKSTLECGKQSPVCCNSSTGTLKDAGFALGVAQICVGDVWRGQQWYVHCMRSMVRTLHEINGTYTA
jgi:sialate O-acetylesterase